MSYGIYYESGNQGRIWKVEEAFLSVEDKRQQYCMKVLAYGHPNDNKQKIY